MLTASGARSATGRSPIDQPTTIREKAPITTAGCSFPSSTARSVISAAHKRLGASRVKPRFTRSGEDLPAGLRRVITQRATTTDAYQTCLSHQACYPFPRTEAPHGKLRTGPRSPVGTSTVLWGLPRLVKPFALPRFRSGGVLAQAGCPVAKSSIRLGPSSPLMTASVPVPAWTPGTERPILRRRSGGAYQSNARL